MELKEENWRIIIRNGMDKSLDEETYELPLDTEHFKEALEFIKQDKELPNDICVSVPTDGTETILISTYDYIESSKYKNKISTHIGQRKPCSRSTNRTTYKKFTFLTLEKRFLHLVRGDISCFDNIHACVDTSESVDLGQTIYRDVLDHLNDAEKKGRLTVVLAIPDQRGIEPANLVRALARAVSDFSRNSYSLLVQEIFLVASTVQTYKDILGLLYDTFPRTFSRIPVIAYEVTATEHKYDNIQVEDGYNAKGMSTCSKLTFKSLVRFQMKQTLTMCIETSDIRACKADAIVCPEIISPDGQDKVLPNAIKLAFPEHKHSSNFMNKLQIKGTTNTHCTDSHVKFLLHARVPLWKGDKNKERWQELSNTMKSIFLKLQSASFRKTEIRTIAIPLFGIVDFENALAVRECCQKYVQYLVSECLAWKNMPLLSVNLVNLCPTINQWLSDFIDEELKRLNPDYYNL